MTSRVALASAVALALLGVAAAPPSPADEPAISVNLTAGPTGGQPEGFVIARTGKGAAGHWAIVDDPDARTGRALAQTTADPTDYRFPLAIYQGISAANIEVTVRFKAVAGQIDRAGGIAVRLTDPDNYYVVRANALEDNVNFYRVVKGARRQIKGAEVKVTANAWHTLSIRSEGNRFAVSFDGKRLFTAEDGSFPGAGKVELWTKADSISRFNDLTIRELP